MFAWVIPRTEIGGPAILMGVRRRDQGRLGKSGVWKTWGTPGTKGTTQGGDALASPPALRSVTPLSLRGPPAEPRAPTPCQFCARSPLKSPVQLTDTPI